MSFGGGEDEAAVFFGVSLRLWGSAQHCEWGQCGPHVPTGASALSQVSTSKPKIWFVMLQGI